jgi:hypothetical protein
MISNITSLEVKSDFVRGCFKSISLIHAILLFLTGFLFSLVFRIDETNPIFYYLALILSFLVYFSVIFLNKKLLIYPLFGLIILMPDLTQSSDELELFGLIKSANLWQFTIGIFTPSTFVFLMLLVVAFRLKFNLNRIFSDKLIIYFGIFIPIVSIYFGFLQNSFSRFFSDYKIVTFFCLGIIVFEKYFEVYKEELFRAIQVFIFLAMGNFFVDVLKYFFYSNNYLVDQSYYNLSMDSSKGLIMIFFFYSFVRIQNGRNLLIHISSILLVMMVLISYQTRWLIVTLVIGILLMLVFLGLYKFFKIGFLIAVITSFIIPFLNFVNPDAFQIIISRFGFIENLKEATEITDLELTRGAAIINSVSTVYDNKAFLTGLGYGSWYTDSYFPMLNLTSAAFDAESLVNRHFYRVHDFLFHFLFKFGIIGLFLYCKSFLSPLFSIWKNKLYLLKNSSFSQLVLLIYIGVLPMVLTFMFTTAKGLLISALFIVTFKLLISYFKTEVDFK